MKKYSVLIGTLAALVLSYGERAYGQLLRQDNELAKMIVLRAEQAIDYPEGSFSIYVELYKELTSILPGITDMRLKAKIEYLRVKAVEYSLIFIETTNPEFPRLVPEGEAWLKTVSRYTHTFGMDWPWNNWYVDPEIWWGLSQSFSDSPIADDMAWEGASQSLMYECEGSLLCEQEKLNNSYVRYLHKYPQGKFYRLALEQVHSFLSERLDELGYDPAAIKDMGGEELKSLKNEISRAHEVLKAVYSQSQDGYIDQVLQEYEAAFGGLLKDTSKITRDTEIKRSGAPPLFYKRPSIGMCAQGESAEYYLRTIQDLMKRQAEYSDPNSIAYIKLLQYLCMERMLSNGPIEQLHGSIKQVDDIKALVNGNHIKQDVLLGLHDQYKNYAVADDIAFEISRNMFTGERGWRIYSGTSLYRNLASLNAREGLYLALHPAGKYAPLVISKVIRMFESIRGESEIRVDYQSNAEDSLISEEAIKLKNILEKCIIANKNLKIAAQALDECNKTLREYLH